MPTARFTADVLAVVNANWTTTAVRVVGPDMQLPPDGAALLAVEFEDSEEEQQTIGALGANAFEEIADVGLVYLVDKRADLGAARTQLEALVSVFRSFTPFGTGSLCASEVRRPPSEPIDFEGGYYGLRAIVTVTRQFAA